MAPGRWPAGCRWAGYPVGESCRSHQSLVNSRVPLGGSGSLFLQTANQGSPGSPPSHLPWPFPSLLFDSGYPLCLVGAHPLPLPLLVPSGRAAQQARVPGVDPALQPFPRCFHFRQGVAARGLGWGAVQSTGHCAEGGEARIHGLSRGGGSRSVGMQGVGPAIQGPWRASWPGATQAAPSVLAPS